MRTRLVFWRHGQTDHNLSLRIQGSQDFELNAAGHEQAAAAAAQLVELKPQLIYSSDLIRAVQTAEYLADLAQVPVRTDPRLRERSYGKWEGLNSDEIRALDVERWQRWRDGLEPGGDVESRQECGLRVQAGVLDALAELETQSADGEYRTVVFVSHGGAIANAIACLLGQDASEWVGFQGMDNCRWAILEERPKANPRWRLNSYNRSSAQPPAISHLGF